MKILFSLVALFSVMLMLLFSGCGSSSSSNGNSTIESDEPIVVVDDNLTECGLPGLPSCPIAAPMSMDASNGDLENSIALRWSVVIDAVGYDLYRSTSAQDTGTRIAVVSASVYVDTNVVKDSTYYYRVKACNYDGCSDFSSYATGRAGTPENEWYKVQPAITSYILD